MTSQWCQMDCVPWHHNDVIWITSHDITMMLYGLHPMTSQWCQMDCVPWHCNDLIWIASHGVAMMSNGFRPMTSQWCQMNCVPWHHNDVKWIASHDIVMMSNELRAMKSIFIEELWVETDTGPLDKCRLNTTWISDYRLLLFWWVCTEDNCLVYCHLNSPSRGLG